jgi:flagellar biosynthetic protein FliP
MNRKVFFIFLFLLSMFVSVSAEAQDININFGGTGASGEGEGGLTTASGTIFRLVILLTILSLAPSILMMMTSFTRIIVVLSLLRSAIGIQQTPPNSVLISLALFMTFFIMQPVLEKSYEQGIVPLINEEIEDTEALKLAAKPFHEFMLEHTRENDLGLFLNIAEEAGSEEMVVETPEDVPYKALIPAFMISELRRAFEIGFLIFIPFLIIDMVVASTLMSMGMMMLPPVLISLPFKIVFFVLIDGWAMLSESLIRSFQ